MFGTMGISELIIILVIVLIIFGAGKLPQIGEGVGKALKGFKKEVHDIPPPEAPQPEPLSPPPVSVQQASAAPAAAPSTAPPAAPTPTSPYTPGPEMTPGTTAASLYNMGPQAPQPPRPRTGSSRERRRSGAADHGRAGGGSDADDAGPISSSPSRRAIEAASETAIGHCEQGCRGARSGAAGGVEVQGRAVRWRGLTGRYAASGRGTRRRAANVQAGSVRRAELG